MWFRKTSARREAIRADVAEVESLERTPRRKYAPVILITFVFFLLATAIQLWPGTEIPYGIGDVAPMDLRSPISFTVFNVEAAERLREARKATSPAVLVANEAAFERIYAQLSSLRTNLRDVHSVDQIPPPVLELFPGLNAATLADLQSYTDTAYHNAVRTFITDTLLRNPFVTPEEWEYLRTRPAYDVKILRFTDLKDAVAELPRGQVIKLGATDSASIAEVKHDVASIFSLRLADLFTTYLLKQSEPTFSLNSKLTELLAQERAEGVQAPGKPIMENDVIVRRGTIIDEYQHKLLREAQAASERQLKILHPWSPLLSLLGQALVVAILTIAGSLYVTRMKSVVTSVRQGWALACLMLLTLFIARGSVALLPRSVFVLGVAPTLLTAIILVIAFSQRTSLALAGLHALLVTFTLGQGVEFFLITLTGVTVFCFMLTEIRTRGRLIEVGVFASGAMFSITWALGLAHLVGSIWNPWVVPTDLHAIGSNSLWAAASGVLVAMFALAILPLVESIFKITTAMTLLELCDASKPLLRRLSQEAPGTFNHSLIVGVMAEAAGNAVGANGLLCRVGAYYHDVGKLSKPLYFIENQTAGGPNRHEKLSPAMSLLIIVGHVKDGIELAREYGLPADIQQFIAQHHGTTLVEFFYHAARRKQEQDPADSPAISDTEFRYPGPKPLSRETAILMICDGAESMVRSIDEPAPGRVEAAVHSLIMKRLMDGQFSECALTLRDLSIIEETLVRTLAGIHHGRVAYPSADAEPTPSTVAKLA